MVRALMGVYFRERAVPRAVQLPFSGIAPRSPRADAHARATEPPDREPHAGGTSRRRVAGPRRTAAIAARAGEKLAPHSGKGFRASSSSSALACGAPESVSGSFGGLWSGGDTGGSRSCLDRGGRGFLGRFRLFDQLIGDIVLVDVTHVADRFLTYPRRGYPL